MFIAHAHIAIRMWVLALVSCVTFTASLRMTGGGTGGGVVNDNRRQAALILPEVSASSGTGTWYVGVPISPTASSEAREEVFEGHDESRLPPLAAVHGNPLLAAPNAYLPSSSDFDGADGGDNVDAGGVLRRSRSEDYGRSDATGNLPRIPTVSSDPSMAASQSSIPEVERRQSSGLTSRRSSPRLTRLFRGVIPLSSPRLSPTTNAAAAGILRSSPSPFSLDGSSNTSGEGTGRSSDIPGLARARSGSFNSLARLGTRCAHGLRFNLVSLRSAPDLQSSELDWTVYDGEYTNPRRRASVDRAVHGGSVFLNANLRAGAARRSASLGDLTAYVPPSGQDLLDMTSHPAHYADPRLQDIAESTRQLHRTSSTARLSLQRVMPAPRGRRSGSNGDVSSGHFVVPAGAPRPLRDPMDMTCHGRRRCPMLMAWHSLPELLKTDNPDISKVRQALDNLRVAAQRSSEECAICLSNKLEPSKDKPLVILKCGHSFCEPCIRRSAQHGVTSHACPC